MGEEDLTTLSESDLQSRLAALRERMRPVELELAALRADRDVILTELRRRERLARRERRSATREAARSGEMATVHDLIESRAGGAFEAYRYHLRTGGEVRLGFPGARSQTIGFTDGRRAAQAGDFDRAAELYGLGWEPGGPGRPGLRIHFPGTRQERLVDPAEVFAARSEARPLTSPPPAAPQPSSPQLRPAG